MSSKTSRRSAARHCRADGAAVGGRFLDVADNSEYAPIMHAVEHDRRRATRRDVNLFVESCTGSPDGSDHATNLSLGGLRLARRLAMPAGTRVEMVLHVPGDCGPMHVAGSVVGGDGPGTGIAFGRLTSRDRLQIAEYLFG